MEVSPKLFSLMVSHGLSTRRSVSTTVGISEKSILLRHHLASFLSGCILGITVLVALLFVVAVSRILFDSSI